MMQQLQLFTKREDENLALYPYWRESLKDWLRDIFGFRHRRFTTGWSTACGGIMFARLLFLNGQMDRAEFRRWWKLDRRILHWDSFAHGTIVRPKPLIRASREQLPTG